MPETFGAEFTSEITFTEDTEISSFLGILVGDVTGANTAFKLLNGNRLALKGSLWEAGEALYGDLWIGYYDRAVSAEADPALVQLGRLTLTGDDPEYAYVVVTIPGVPEMRFRLSAESVYGSINVLTGEEFDYDSLIDIVYAVLGSSTLTLEGSSLGATLLSTESDTLLNDFFGAEFTASANVSFFFEENEFAFDEEDYPVPTVTILKEDGTELSENTVMAMVQDHDGMLWFATWDGINRFDGYDFQVYKARKSKSRPCKKYHSPTERASEHSAKNPRPQHPY